MVASDSGGSRHRRRIYGRRRENRDSRQSDRESELPARARPGPTKGCRQFSSKFVADNTPAGITTEVRVLSGGPAVIVNPDHPAIDTAAKAFSEILGRPTVFISLRRVHSDRGGLRAASRHPDDSHGFRPARRWSAFANEKYKIANYYTGIMTVAHFLELYGQS